LVIARANGAKLQQAVREARRIRRNLVRLRRETDLGGDCGLASILLADAIGDVRTLRHTADTTGRFCTPHVWNEVGGVIIDVTATQFNDSSESDDAGEPAVFGVLVTRQPRVYHRPVAGRGGATLAYLSDANWYEDQDHRRLRAAMERLRALLRA
jgi:hypothetical protein